MADVCHGLCSMASRRERESCRAKEVKGKGAIFTPAAEGLSKSILSLVACHLTVQASRPFSALGSLRLKTRHRSKVDLK